MWRPGLRSSLFRRPAATSRGARGIHADSHQRPLPAVFARGGTSNGLVFWRHHLPPMSEWHRVLPAVMGSPDPYGRQLDGMGSGISSTSKICVLAPCSDPGVADVEFTFVQVGVGDGSLDMAGNCGNMLSVVGPVAFDDAPVPLGRVEGVADPATGARTAVVRILNTNTSKVVHARFPVVGDPPRYCPDGDYEMDGVPGKQARIALRFLGPGGAKTGRTLPTGNPVDALALPGGATIEASLVDVSNPGVFVRASDVGFGVGDAATALLTPAAVDADVALKARLEQIRQAGAAMMGLDPQTQSVPKIVLVFPPDVARHSPGVDVKCLALSMGQAHKAVPLTLALCLAAAAKLPGTIPFQLASGASKDAGAVVIGHPSGRLDIGVAVENGEVLSAELYRTARVLMRGEVYY